ncbi:MAG: LysM peptidoglycan-binding domain-containing protein [Chloroflexi bacterium]|nr:LysM peptidoglycan-binding domain-containing protein [Chloroflexota bacterium]
MTRFNRLLLPTLILFFTTLACARGPVDPGAGGHVTPVGSLTPTLEATPMPPTAAPTVEATPTTPFSYTPLPPLVPGETLLYRVQSGDTLGLLVQRFNVPLEDLLKLNQLSAGESLQADEIILIPARLDQTGPNFKIVPDSELVYSIGVAGFDTEDFVKAQGGYLSHYREFVRETMRSGAEIVQLVAVDHSISPRILLAILEYQSGWVTDPAEPADKAYPIDYRNPARDGLFQQLDWLADTLNLGYYRWRDGSVTALDFPDGSQQRIHPTLNAGTVALQFAFSRLYNDPEWSADVGPDGLYSAYTRLFGDPFERSFEPLIPDGLTQPELRLPFVDGHEWLYISGPHAAWEPGSPWAALDFAPPSLEAGCIKSDEWVVAPAAGLVVRSGDGVVVLDLDGDGREQSGWTVLFLHIAAEGRVPTGRTIEVGDLIGHPSCEGGRSIVY